MRLSRALIALSAVLGAGCSGSAASPANPCNGIAYPLVFPAVFLSYPSNASTNVPTSIGEVVVDGAAVNQSVLSLSTGATTVVSATPAPAPSPLPSPLATPPAGITPSYSSITVPTLGRATTYSVTYTYIVTSSAAPQCSMTTSVPLGSFSTSP